MTNNEIVEQNKKKYIGKSKYNNQGVKMTIVDYINTRNIVVKFEDGTTRRTSLGLYNRGSVKKPTKHIGAINKNAFGTEMKVIQYTSYSDIVVEFQDKWKSVVHTTWLHFERGNVKNPYDLNKYGARLGNTYGLHSTSKEIRSWYNILQRATDSEYQEKHPTYIGCGIDESWLLFENYYQWLIAQENYQQWKNGLAWAVDKDILVKHNKIYSPSTCCLVPQSVNNLFLRHESVRGNYPIGVTYRQSDGMFMAQCNNPWTNKQEKLGNFVSSTDAFAAYKAYKENICKQVATEEFTRHNITLECYLALQNYRVDVND